MELRQRRNHRLKGYDYSSHGYYYVTICTLNRANLLCDITVTGNNDTKVTYDDTKSIIFHETKVIPTEIGLKVIECWENMGSLNQNIGIDKFVIMPNHIHGIIIIDNEGEIEANSKEYGFEIQEHTGRRSLQGLIRDFKSVTTRHYKKLCNANSSLWQSSFYDEIIRSQKHYESVWTYIDSNPQKWQEDDLYNLRT